LERVLERVFAVESGLFVVETRRSGSVGTVLVVILGHAERSQKKKKTTFF